MKKLLIAAALLLGVSPAFGQASYIIKDGNGAFQTIKSFNCSSTICPGSVPMDQTGAAFGTAANPFAMTFGSGVTLPAFTATPSIKLQDGSGTAITSTGGSLNVNITGGGTGGGAVFGPTAVGSANANPPIVVGGTVTGAAGQNVVGATVKPASTQAASTDTGLVVQLNPNSPGLITLGTAGSPSSSVLSIQGIGGMTALAVTGTFFQTTQPVSVASLPLPTGASTAAKQPALGTAGSSSTDVLSVQGIASMTPFLANPGTAANWGILAQGSTTAAQLGQLMMGAVTTASPSYTTTQTSPLSIDANGGLRVNVIAGGITGSVSNATSAVATSSSNLPTVGYSYGFNGATWDQLQVDASKFLKVNCATGCGGAGTVSNASSAQASTSTNVGSVAWNYGFNGSTWDQLQVDGSKNLKVLEANSGAIVTALGTLNTTAGNPLATQVPTVSIGGVGIIDAGGTNKATVKAASTAPVAGDTSLVVSLNPNNAANSVPYSVSQVPSATGGWSKWSTAKNNSNTPLTTTVVQVKGSAGTWGGYFISNTNASQGCLQIFDAATAGAVTLGTTRPDLVYCVSPGGANLEISMGVNFAAGIQVAWTTTASGSTAPSVGTDASFYFK